MMDHPESKCDQNCLVKKAYNIYKDPITDDGIKKSLKGLCAVHNVQIDSWSESGPEMMAKGLTPTDCWEIQVKTECTPEEEKGGLLQVIYEDGKFYNPVTLTEIRERINKIV